MIIDNPMATGRGQAIAERPRSYCPECKGVMYHGEAIYEWEGGRWMCGECLSFRVGCLDEDELAEKLGLERSEVE